MNDSNNSCLAANFWIRQYKINKPFKILMKQDDGVAVTPAGHMHIICTSVKIHITNNFQVQSIIAKLYNTLSFITMSVSVNDLPRVVTQPRPGHGSNPRPLDHPTRYTTTPPSPRVDWICKTFSPYTHIRGQKLFCSSALNPDAICAALS